MTIVLHVVLNLFLMGGFHRQVSWTILIYANAGLGTFAYLLILRVMCSDAGIQPRKMRIAQGRGSLEVIDEEEEALS